MQPCRILGINGSLRGHSYNGMALELLASLLPSVVQFETAGIRDLPLFDEDLESSPLHPSTGRLAQAIAAADGLVIACPEYNHSLTSALKNALDWMSRDAGKPLEHKPVMIISAATGPLGGARVQYELRRVLDAVGALPMVKPEVFIGMAHAKLSPGGHSADLPTIAALTTQFLAFREFMDRHKRPPPHGSSQTRPQPAADLHSSDAPAEYDTSR